MRIPGKVDHNVPGGRRFPEIFPRNLAQPAPVSQIPAAGGQPLDGSASGAGFLLQPHRHNGVDVLGQENVLGIHSLLKHPPGKQIGGSRERPNTSASRAKDGTNIHLCFCHDKTTF